MHGSLWRAVSIVAVLGLLGSSALALDTDHRRKADAALSRGIAYLRKTQNADGSWSPRPGPAITAMIMSVMLDRPNITVTDPAVDKALAYVLSKVKDDGGIHDRMLQNYNTAICLTALAKVKGRPDVAAAVGPGQQFLGRLQWHDQLDPNGEKIGPSHPFYGGAGYGIHGRPDLSNTQVMLQALHDSGLSSDDPVFRRAMVFVTRCQGTTANTDLADKIAPDGGFIYATSRDKQHIGQPQSMAGCCPSLPSS